VIRFSCPNGHIITARDEHAGRENKCPKCGVAIVVPPASAGPGADGTEAAPAPGSDDTIVFLCPNGHRLHGPRSLEGRAGQCPHCGARFRVPSHDDPEEEEEGSRILVGATPGAGELAVQGIAPGDSGPKADEPFFNFSFDDAPRGERGSSVVADTPLIDTGSAQRGDHHPLAELFTRFWDEKSRGAFVELHLAQGAVVVPERYARDLSGGRYGVFAVKDADGTHTLTVVEWDTIARISVRRVSKLPRKLFD
jgi:hypothetical protein